MSVEELEVLRKKARNIKIIGFGCSIIIFLLVISKIKTLPFSFFAFLIGLLITVIVSAKPTKNFTLAFKQTFVLK